MSSVDAGEKPQAVWLSNDVADDDAFDDPGWETIDPGPVLGREQADRWLGKQPRPVPVVHVPERRERPRERRARHRARLARRAATLTNPGHNSA